MTRTSWAASLRFPPGPALPQIVQRSSVCRGRLDVTCGQVRDLRKDPRYQRIRRPSDEEAEELRQRSAAALATLRGLAATLASGAEPSYETGVMIWQTAMEAVGPKS